MFGRKIIMLKDKCFVPETRSLNAKVIHNNNCYSTANYKWYVEIFEEGYYIRTGRYYLTGKHVGHPILETKYAENSPDKNYQKWEIKDKIKNVYTNLCLKYEGNMIKVKDCELRENLSLSNFVKQTTQPIISNVQSTVQTSLSPIQSIVTQAFDPNMFKFKIFRPSCKFRIINENFKGAIISGNQNYSNTFDPDSISTHWRLYFDVTQINSKLSFMIVSANSNRCLSVCGDRICTGVPINTLDDNLYWSFGIKQTVQDSQSVSSFYHQIVNKKHPNKNIRVGTSGISQFGVKINILPTLVVGHKDKNTGSSAKWKFVPVEEDLKDCVGLYHVFKHGAVFPTCGLKRESDNCNCLALGDIWNCTPARIKDRQDRYQDCYLLDVPDDQCLAQDMNQALQEKCRVMKLGFCSREKIKETRQNCKTVGINRIHCTEPLFNDCSSLGYTVGCTRPKVDKDKEKCVKVGIENCNLGNIRAFDKKCDINNVPGEKCTNHLLNECQTYGFSGSYPCYGENPFNLASLIAFCSKAGISQCNLRNAEDAVQKCESVGITKHNCKLDLEEKCRLAGYTEKCSETEIRNLHNKCRVYEIENDCTLSNKENLESQCKKFKIPSDYIEHFTISKPYVPPRYQPTYTSQQRPTYTRYEPPRGLNLPTIQKQNQCSYENVNQCERLGFENDECDETKIQARLETCDKRGIDRENCHKNAINQLMEDCKIYGSSPEDCTMDRMNDCQKFGFSENNVCTEETLNEKIERCRQLGLEDCNITNIENLDKSCLDMDIEDCTLQKTLDAQEFCDRHNTDTCDSDDRNQILTRCQNVLVPEDDCWNISNQDLIDKETLFSECRTLGIEDTKCNNEEIASINKLCADYGVDPCNREELEKVYDFCNLHFDDIDAKKCSFNVRKKIKEDCDKYLLETCNKELLEEARNKLGIFSRFSFDEPIIKYLNENVFKNMSYNQVRTGFWITVILSIIIIVGILIYAII